MQLSIIIPAREEEKVIAQTVTQFRGTLTIPHEIIVADGGSKDHTLEIARDAGAVVLSFVGAKHKAAIGRNDGARVAQGDYFVFIDAGTTIPNPQAFFTHALAHFASNPKIVALTGPQEADPALATLADRISFSIFNTIIRFQNNVLHGGEATGKFMFVSRGAFEKIGGFREDLATREDGDFFNRLSKIGRTVYDPALKVYHGARRAHAMGWGRLWWIWSVNVVSLALFNKAVADDWTPIR